MKNTPWLALALTLFSLCARGQVSPTPAKGQPVLVEIGPNSRTWSIPARDSTPTGAPPGSGTANDSETRPRVVEIATGMNYWDGQQWVPSDPSFDVTEDAFVATRLQHKVRLGADLNTIGAVTVTTRDGITLHSTPVGIGLYDAASGRSAIIAATTNSYGVLVSSNRVVYPNAFSGICADVVYTIHRHSFEQDVVITGRLDPVDYGFPTNTTRIQIYTEFYGNPPQPERIRRPIWVEPNKTVRDRMASPDLVDEVLGFGEFVLATGRAATLSTITADPVAGGAPVAKQFTTIAGRTFLIESLQYSAIQKELLKLPECGVETAAIQKGGEVKKPAKVRYAAIPSPSSTSYTKTVPGRSTTRMAVAAVSRHPGVVIDYVATVGPGLQVPIVFQGDTTYFVKGAVACNGVTTVEGGAVFKFRYHTVAPAGYAYIQLNGTLTCNTSSYRPAIFTAVDDDSVGESMNPNTNPAAPPLSDSGYTGDPSLSAHPDRYANPALLINYLGAQTWKNLRFSYCQEALRVQESDGHTGHTLWHAQLVNCVRGIVITSPGCGSASGCGDAITVNNGLFAGVQYPVTDNFSDTSVGLYHCTVDGGSASILASFNSSTSCIVNFFNSILANITTLKSGGSGNVSGDYNGVYNCGFTSPGTHPVTASGPPFQSPVVAGNYYLTAGHSFRNAGTTTGVPIALRNDLKKMTTYQPIQLVSAMTVPTTLSPQAQRDTDTPDLGYHYDALDYILNNIALSATLTLTNGVAVGLQGTYGLSLQTGGHVTGEGTPLQMNRFASLANVQEQPVATGGSTFLQLNSGSIFPRMDFRFTDFSIDQGKSGALLDTGPNNFPFERLSFCDSWLHDGAISLSPVTASPVTAAFTNNILDRCKLTISRGSTTPFSACFYNNLFLSDPNSATPGTPPALALSYSSGGSNPTWELHDNLFDKATQTMTPNNPIPSSVQLSNNGFTTGTTQGLVGTSDQTGVAVTYQIGSLGNYYLPTAATQLIDHGSRTADLAGLYHYTTTTDNVKEQGSQVDIGFHYVALNGSKPVDTDGDGLPDYLEDRNGNGVYDTSDLSNWTLLDTDGDGLADAYDPNPTTVNGPTTLQGLTIQKCPLP